MGVLSHRIYGSGENVIYILHGIFGMKDNWHYIAGKLAEEFTVVTCDARNHGKSFHDHDMSYDLMADDLAGLMETLGHGRAMVMGHSMGGKTAMKFSARYPDNLDKLIVVDIALKAYQPGHIPYFKAFETIDFTVIQSRSEAEQAFMPYAPDPSVRQFLLKNLEPVPGGGYKPRFNLPAIKEFYEESIGEISLPIPCWDGPTLFIHGSDSTYLTDSDKPAILNAFPHAIFREVSRAGHWVHADNPEEFLTLLRHFILH